MPHTGVPDGPSGYDALRQIMPAPPHVERTCQTGTRREMLDRNHARTGARSRDRIPPAPCAEMAPRPHAHTRERVSPGAVRDGGQNGADVVLLFRRVAQRGRAPERRVHERGNAAGRWPATPKRRPESRSLRGKAHQETIPRGAPRDWCRAFDLDRLPRGGRERYCGGAHHRVNGTHPHAAWRVLVARGFEGKHRLNGDVELAHLVEVQLREPPQRVAAIGEPGPHRVAVKRHEAQPLDPAVGLFTHLLPLDGRQAGRQIHVDRCPLRAHAREAGAHLPMPPTAGGVGVDQFE